jgi:uncharacterized membrane protein YdbT with pleckstrin-like domain
MDLHPGEHIIYEGHPSWRSTFGFYVLGLLIVAAAVVIGVIADEGAIGAAVGGGLLLILLIVGWLKRVTTRYLITDRRLQIRRGILARRTEETRVDRIVDVTVSQSVWKRIVRIGDVDFDNASGGQERDLFRFTGVANPHGVVRAVNEVHEHGGPPAAVGR